MRAKTFKLLPLIGILTASAALAGCSDVLRLDRSATTLVIDALDAAPVRSNTFAGTLQSDVSTVVAGSATVFSDTGRVTIRTIMKDPLVTPSAVNAVTVNRYRVTYRRSDGRNTPGVDVPFPFDSATTFTVAPGVTVTRTFELVRQVSKAEAPLLALAANGLIISTIADVTFFGEDQTGNDLSASGSIGVQFGNFADQ